ncbi:MAG TPA: carboxymuconolactone decarboxylase family protein [Candidatus Binatia bacterium]|nr:carboxymuconolactone decarboxylase family protein [Candidatus Binatia bacterium]
METKTKFLIAVGAAFITQCQPCLKTVIMKTIDSGADEKEIAEAIGVAKVVRRNAITQIDRFAAALTDIEADECAANSCSCRQNTNKTNSEGR